VRPIGMRAAAGALLLALLAPLAFGQSAGRGATTIRYASGFTVTDHGSYRLLTVSRPWPGARREFRYLLVNRGSPVPSGYPDVPVIRVPIRSIVALSSTYLAEIVELGRLSTIKGVESLSYVYDPAIRRRVEQGSIATVGEGQSLNLEQLIEMKPDVIMTSAFGGAGDVYPKLQELGLPVVINGDWAEATPLGRAEWIKFIALFYGEEAVAKKRFDRVAAEYHRLAALAAGARSRPTVFVNAPWQGSWGMPGGRSYEARLLHDAGADYLWSHTDSEGTLFLDFEAVFDRAANADYWIDPGSWRSLAQGAKSDPRFTQFKAFREHRLYNITARTSPDGGNDYWESGPANPQLVLGDLIEIFHPGLLPDRKLYFYERLE